ncbi:putative quinol monooxygenase [Streptomyces sp. NPDC059009]|uniref:putative quinol monooxygenase n=1 Tax=Streptomyces sp. NPDC059009 TaxID=3346694 RepID=UPI003677719F
MSPAPSPSRHSCSARPAWPTPPAWAAPGASRLSRAWPPERWLDDVRAFSEACRAEEGCLFFDWTRSVEDPTRYTLVEGFRDEEAGQLHVQSAHFKTAMAWIPDAIAAKPEIVHTVIEGVEGFGPMASSPPAAAATSP